jgi:hypothetical protein
MQKLFIRLIMCSGVFAGAMGCIGKGHVLAAGLLILIIVLLIICFVLQDMCDRYESAARTAIEGLVAMKCGAIPQDPGTIDNVLAEVDAKMPGKKEMYEDFD